MNDTLLLFNYFVTTSYNDSCNNRAFVTTSYKDSCNNRAFVRPQKIVSQVSENCTNTLLKK